MFKKLVFIAIDYFSQLLSSKSLVYRRWGTKRDVLSRLFDVSITEKFMSWARFITE